MRSSSAITLFRNSDFDSHFTTESPLLTDFTSALFLSF